MRARNATSCLASPNRSSEAGGRLMWTFAGTAVAAAMAVATPIWPAFGGPGAPGSEILVGNIMPYTGPMAAFGSIGRAEAAYFDMINDRGGINGRKVRFISYDDSSDPVTTAEQT